MMALRFVRACTGLLYRAGVLLQGRPKTGRTEALSGVQGKIGAAPTTPDTVLDAHEEDLRRMRQLLRQKIAVGEGVRQGNGKLRP